MSRTLRPRGLVLAFIVLAASACWVGCSPTPPSCVYSLSRSTVTLPALGASDTVAITTTSGCSWTATSGASWLTLSPASGSGSGAVTVTAGPNGAAPRSAAVTIASLTVTVTQETAPPPTYSLSGKVTDVFLGPSPRGGFGLSAVAVAVAGGPSQGAATTDFAGDYTISGLLAGTYTVTFQKTYFRPASATVTLSGPATLPMTLSLDVPASPSASNLTGYWTGVGTYPNNPFKLALIQTGNQFRGWYVDQHDASPSVSEWPAGGGVTLPEFTLLVNFGDAGLLLECVVEDARRVKGVQRTPSLGNRPFPFDMTR